MPSPPCLPPSLLPALPFGIAMISLRARKSANFIREMITFTNRQHKHGQGVKFARATSLQSVYSVLLDLTSSNGPIVARQIPRNQHAIVRASYRNFKRANFQCIPASLPVETYVHITPRITRRIVRLMHN